MNLVPILVGSLTNILVKMLMNALGEKQLAKILFSVLAYFAAKTANDTDDRLVSWAKTLYPDGDALEQHVEVPSPAFILEANTRPLE